RMLGVLGMLHAFVCAHLSLQNHPPARLPERTDPRKSQTDVTEWCRTGRTSQFIRADARLHRLRAAARCRCRYRPVWSRATRGRAIPGSPADRRHVTTSELQKNAAVRVALRCQAAPGPRATVPSRAG